MPSAAEIVHFWCEDCEPRDWYRQDADFDAAIASRFGARVAEAQAGGLTAWETDPEGLFALIILIDQFSRNIYRGQARAFAGDPRGLALAERAVACGFDQHYPMPQRQFFLLPFIHAEDLGQQDRGIQLMQDRLGPEGADNVLHARAHREIIARFGRFPYRNSALGRASTQAEIAFLEAGGYGPVLREMQSRYPATSV